MVLGGVGVRLVAESGPPRAPPNLAGEKKNRPAKKKTLTVAAESEYVSSLNQARRAPRSRAGEETGRKTTGPARRAERNWPKRKPGAGARAGAKGAARGRRASRGRARPLPVFSRPVFFPAGFFRPFFLGRVGDSGMKLGLR